MIVKLVALLLVWFLTDECVRSQSGEDGIVATTSSACKLDGTILLCNYLNYDESVYLEQLLAADIQKVVIKNSKKLRISDTICINITVENCPDVVVRPGPNMACESDMQLSARSTTLDTIPFYVNRLVLENSSLATLSTSSILKTLKVINSSIKVADVRKPLYEESNILIVNSTLSSLRKLHLESGSNLTFEDSKVYIANSDALVFQGGFGMVKNSFVDNGPEDGILLFPGTSFAIAGSSGMIKMKVVKEITTSKVIYVCPNIPTYYGGFVTCLVLLILTLCFTIPYIFYLRRLIDHIGQRSEKPDVYDLGYRVASSEMQASQTKNAQYVSVPTVEAQSSNDDINMEQYQCVLENTKDLNNALAVALQSEKKKHQETLTEKRTKVDDELAKLTAVSQEKIEQLENSKNFELQSLETQYNDEFNSPTMIFWEKIKEILEQSKMMNEKLIDVKYKCWKFDIRVQDDVPNLQEKVYTVSINKEFIAKVTTSIKDHLNQWPEIFTVIKDTNIDSDVAERLFVLLENLLWSYEAGIEENYERQIREQDNTYLSDVEHQTQELENFCTNFKTSTEKEKESMLADKTKSLESKLPWTKKYTDEVEHLYIVTEQLLDTVLSYEIKKAEDKYSETRLKLMHLDAITQIQEAHMNNLETIIKMITNAMDLSIKTLKLGIYDERDTQYINDTRRVSNRSKQLFMDRYGQA